MKHMNFKTSEIASRYHFKKISDILVFTPHYRSHLSDTGYSEAYLFIKAVLSDDSEIELEHNYNRSYEDSGIKDGVKEKALTVYDQLKGKDVKGLIITEYNNNFRKDIIEYVPLPNGIENYNYVISEEISGTIPSVYCQESDNHLLLNNDVALDVGMARKLAKKLTEWADTKWKDIIKDIEFDLVFMVNGTIIFQTPEFCHLYHDVSVLTDDLNEFFMSRITQNCNEPEHRIEYNKRHGNIYYHWFNQYNFNLIKTVETRLENIIEFRKMYYTEDNK